MSDIKELIALMRQEAQFSRDEATLAREEAKIARESHADEIKLMKKQHDDMIKQLLTQKGIQISSNNETAKLITGLSARLTTFVFDPENDQTFSKWYERSESVFTIDGVDLDDAAQVRLLIGKLSDHVFERFKRHILPQEPNDLTFDDTIKLLKELFDVKRSLFTLRYHCLMLSKLPTEDFMEYTGRVNEQCERAKLHDLDSEGIKTLLWVYGLKSDTELALRHKLLVYLDQKAKEGVKVTLHDLYLEYDRYVTVKNNSKLIEDSPKRVNEVKRFEKKTFQKSTSSANPQECWNCGLANHRSNQCRKPKWRCGKCKGTGHKDQFCEKLKAFKEQVRQKPRRNCQQVVAKTDVGGVAVNVVREYKTVVVNGHNVTFQLDTGSDVTLINIDQWKEMGEPKLEKPTLTVQNASGDAMNILGKLECEFRTEKATGTGYAYITPHANLMGLSWIRQSDEMSYHLKMMAVSQTQIDSSAELVQELKEKYAAVFEEGLGLCTKEQAKLKVDKSSKPVFRGKRPVPHAVLETVEKELDRLISMGVIEQVTHSEWAAPIVTVRKANGKVRVCADFSTGLVDPERSKTEPRQDSGYH